MAAKTRSSPQILAVAQGNGFFFWPKEYPSKPWWQDLGTTIPLGPNVVARAPMISKVLFLSSAEAVLPFQIAG